MSSPAIVYGRPTLADCISSRSIVTGINFISDPMTAFLAAVILPLVWRLADSTKKTSAD